MIDEALQQQYKEKSKELKRLNVLQNSLDNDLSITCLKRDTCYTELKELEAKLLKQARQ